MTVQKKMGRTLNLQTIGAERIHTNMETVIKFMLIWMTILKS